MGDTIPFIIEVIQPTENRNRPQAASICHVSARGLEIDPNIKDCPIFSSLFNLKEGGDVHCGSIEICAGDTGLEQALCVCLMTMGPGQICRVALPSLGINSQGEETTGNINFILELLSITYPLPVYKLSDSEKQSLAIKEKQLGVALNAHGALQASAQCFQRSLRLLIAMDQEAPDTGSLRCALYNNLSLHQLRRDRPAYAAELADRVLEREPLNTKALWRRGQAAQALGDLSAAQTFYARLLTVEPANAPAAARLRSLEAENRAADEGMATMARAMLGL